MDFTDITVTAFQPQTRTHKKRRIRKKHLIGEYTQWGVMITNMKWEERDYSSAVDDFVDFAESMSWGCMGSFYNPAAVGKSPVHSNPTDNVCFFRFIDGKMRGAIPAILVCCDLADWLSHYPGLISANIRWIDVNHWTGEPE